MYERSPSDRTRRMRSSSPCAAATIMSSEMSFTIAGVPVRTTDAGL